MFGYVSVLVNSTSACVKRKHVEALTELIVVCDVKLTIKYAIISHLMMLTQHCFICGFQSKFYFIVVGTRRALEIQLTEASCLRLRQCDAFIQMGPVFKMCTHMNFNGMI